MNVLLGHLQYYEAWTTGVSVHWLLGLRRATKHGSRSHSPEEVPCLCACSQCGQSSPDCTDPPSHVIVLPKMCVSGMSLSFSHSRPGKLVLERLTKSPKCRMFILFVFCPPQQSWVSAATDDCLQFCLSLRREPHPYDLQGG